MSIKHWGRLLLDAFKDWQADNAPRLGASISYYTIFSLAPILLIAIAVAGFLFGEEAARGEVMEQMKGLVGAEGGQAIQTMLENANRPGQGTVALITGLAALLFGATGAFVELQNALNTVWDVPTKEGGGVLAYLKNRLLSFALVVGVGFLLIVSLIVSALLAGLGHVLEDQLALPPFVLQLINLVVALAVLTAMFALIFRILPDARIAWHDVWIGGFITAVLFTIGKLLIGLYLGQSSVSSSYGAAGSIVLILVWVYYSAQIVLYGAEITQVYANRFGSRLTPEVEAA